MAVTTRGQRRSWRRLSAAIGAVAALAVGAGCAQEASPDLLATEPAGFAATPDYIGKVIDNSTSEAFRYSMTFSFGMGGAHLDAELATGAVNGKKSQLQMDFGALFEQLGAGEELPSDLSPDDLTMEQVVDGQSLYIRAPFFTAMADSMPSGSVSEVPGGAMLDAFTALGDDWGRVDLDALGDVLPSKLQESLTGQSTSPDAFLDMLRRTSEVKELGTDTIDGEPVNGLAADVDLGDMLAAEGLDPDTMFGSTSPLDMSSLTFPLEAWVGEDGKVRRIDFRLDEASLANVAEDNGENVPEDLGDFEVGIKIDFSDYGDDSIKIEAPSDAKDVTDEFVAAYDEMFGG